MRTFFAQVGTRYRAIKICPFAPAHVAKVFGGYMCFESDNDYRVWKNQKQQFKTIKDMRTNNNNPVDFSSKQTYVASESLLQ